MALMRDLSQAQLAFQVHGHELADFLVARYRGTEGFCQLYRFEVDLISRRESVVFDDIVGKPATLSINTANGPRWFHGIVSRFEFVNNTVEQSYYRAELVPNLWLLTHRYRCRIFQNMVVTDIIREVLTDGGVSTDRVRFEVEAGEPREYCVQYRETDCNFIARLMEEEGVRWFFEHTEEACTLIIADHTSAYQPIENKPQLLYHEPTGMNTETEYVRSFRLGQSVRPGAVALQDFDFENPKLDLQSTADAGRDPGLEFHDYPGEYTKQNEGRRYARIRAEEFQASRIIGVGLSTSHRLAPNRTFELTEHPTDTLNAEYVVTTISHQGRQSQSRTSDGNGRAGILDARTEQIVAAARLHDDTVVRDLAEGLLELSSKLRQGDPSARRELSTWLFHAGQVARDLPSIASAAGSNPADPLSMPNLLDELMDSAWQEIGPVSYECRFECLPAQVTYRPPRVTPWPVMRGSQTARVVGRKSEEIDCDKYGRVKVQFNWDREGKFDENSSCWIRVSQGMAGGQYGMMFLPRVGQEVVVDFLEGDPDKPIVVGRVFNADHMPPYKLPDEKTKSVIKTHSSKGGGGTNEIRIEDLKDKEQVLIYSQKDMHVHVNNDRVENIDHDRHLTVKENKFELVKKNKHAEIKLDQNEKIGGDQSLAVKGKVSIKIDGNETLDIGQSLAQKIGASHKHDVAQTYALKATGIKLEASTGIELKCGGSSIVLTPAAIFITGGPLVNINTGSGPPVSPAIVQPSPPIAPQATLTADTVEPGKDTTYSGGEELVTLEPPETVKGHKVETSWIEIELVDEAGQPVVGETYSIKDGEGELVDQGTTGFDGLAHVLLPKKGTYMISFPNLDAEAWERLG